MPHYIQSGTIPPKRHTQFRQPNGKLYSEELFSTEGFSNDSSLLYHIHPPTQILRTDKQVSVMPRVAEEKMLSHRSFEGFHILPATDYLDSRKPVLINNDLHTSLAAPEKPMEDYFFKNADADELIFVHEGSGTLRTVYGNLAFSYGDYIIIPRGTVYQIEFSKEKNRLFIVESFSPIRYPKKYLSKNGQLLEHAPYCERDIRQPKGIQAVDQAGDFLIKVKKQGMLYGIHYAHHPFDVGDGTVVVIPTFFRFIISNPLQVECTSHRPYT